MTTDGAVKNYKFGQKNNWRRSVWNEVIRRTNGREQSESVLYLAGPDDHDRQIAVEKGIPDENLVAIDRSLKNVRACRKDGASAVHGEMKDVLMAWPDSRPVCAVLLDWCGGLGRDAFFTGDALIRPVFWHAVIMVNLMRGRDHWSNGMRQMLKELPGAFTAVSASDGELDPLKNRAVQFMLFRAAIFFDKAIWRGRDGDPETYFAELDVFLKSLHPWTRSYQSGKLIFDSAIFTSPEGAFFGGQSQIVAGALRESVNSSMIKTKDPSMSRQLSAVMAVRTRRMASR